MQKAIRLHLITRIITAKCGIYNIMFFLKMIWFAKSPGPLTVQGRNRGKSMYYIAVTSMPAEPPCLQLPQIPPPCSLQYFFAGNCTTQSKARHVSIQSNPRRKIHFPPPPSAHVVKHTVATVQLARCRCPDRLSITESSQSTAAKRYSQDARATKRKRSGTRRVDTSSQLITQGMHCERTRQAIK